MKPITKKFTVYKEKGVCWICTSSCRYIHCISCSVADTCKDAKKENVIVIREKAYKGEACLCNEHIGRLLSEIYSKAMKLRHPDTMYTITEVSDEPCDMCTDHSSIRIKHEKFRNYFLLCEEHIPTFLDMIRKIVFTREKCRHTS